MSEGQGGYSRFNESAAIVFTYAPEERRYESSGGYADHGNALAFDDDCILWVGTNKGLYRFEETPFSVEEQASIIVPVRREYTSRGWNPGDGLGPQRCC